MGENPSAEVVAVVENHYRNHQKLAAVVVENLPGHPHCQTWAAVVVENHRSLDPMALMADLVN